MVNTSYGFIASTGKTSTREKLTSGYLRATGVKMDTSEEFAGNGTWWLRSPSHTQSYLAYYIYSNGYISVGTVHEAQHGIVPALTIRIS